MMPINKKGDLQMQLPKNQILYGPPGTGKTYSVVRKALEIVYSIAINTGMRQGEILGLPWKNIDFEKGIIHVNQTLANYGTEIVTTTKNDSSRRSIAIPKELVKELREYKHEQNKAIIKLGALYENNGLVNASEKGTPLSPNNLRRNFNLYIAKAKVNKIRFHDLRHTHASLLLKDGTNPKIIAERLGHANTRMTLDRYSHLFPNLQAETAEQFGRILYDQTGNTTSGPNLTVKEPTNVYVTTG